MIIDYKKKIKIENYLLVEIIKLQNQSGENLFFKLMSPDIYAYILHILNQKIRYSKIKDSSHVITKLKYEIKTIKKNSYLVFLKSFFTKEKYLPPFFLKEKKAFTWVQNNLFKNYAYKKNIDLFQSRKYDWFPTPKKYKAKYNRKEFISIINLIQTVLLKINKSISLDKNDLSKIINDLRYLRFWSEKNIIYLRQKKVPKIFFAGTMRSALNRVMSQVVNENGGYTIVFEHGCGAGIVKDTGYIWDFLYASRFISNKLAPGHPLSILKYFKNQNFLKENIKIEYSKNSLTKIKRKNKSNKILKAVFVVTTTNENFFHIGPGMISVNQTTFILTQLKEIFSSLNIELSVKLHPEQNSYKLISYCKKNNIKTIGGYLKEMDMSDTIFIFENVTSTSFYDLYLSEKPLIILHNPLIKFIYKAYLKIKKRATIYNLKYSGDQFYINKSKLKKKIQKLTTNYHEK